MEILLFHLPYIVCYNVNTMNILITPKMSLIAVAALIAFLFPVLSVAAENPSQDQQQTEHKAMTLNEIFTPYSGPTETGADTSTLHNKVMCGYQGWFMAKDDGYNLGYTHWGSVDRNPPGCTVDLWPDLTEFEQDELFPTNYRHNNGQTAYVFSSTVKKTVLRHFKWMKQYGIEGVFVQRFGSCIKNQADNNYLRTSAVLSHCREGANQYGRAFAVMYDVSFDRRSIDIIKADWAKLINEMKLTQTNAYLKHNGKPIIALWGYGFRSFDPIATEELFKFLQDEKNGGCTIFLGVPNEWRSWNDQKMTLLEKYADIISPWNVGRYNSPEGAKKHFAKYWPQDIEWCSQRNKDYYAVVFPGFSWTNLKNGRSPLNQIPRLGGRFFASQIDLVKYYGMNMAYIAMFDEVDEGTAIFKCTNYPPIGSFMTYEGLPSDHYLKLAGIASKYLRGEN